VGLFGGIFRRPHEATVSGSVSRHENHWVMLVRTLNSRGQPIAGRTWCAEDSGPGARERVIRRAAACVLVSEGKYPVTRNADSLAELAEARRLLAGRPGEAELREAGRALRRSLTRDPFNWLARFELAVVSRQLGDYEEAVGACEQLEAQVEEERAKLSDPDSHLGRFLQSEPALASYIRYNRALALSKMERWPEHNQAKILLDELADGRDTSIRCLARSAQAATLLFEFDEIEEEADNDEDRARYQQRRYEIEEKVREIVKEVDRDVHEQTERANRAWALARAVAHNALGYVLMELKPVRKEAPEQFRLAAALAPSFIEPHLNLGRWHRRRDALEGEQRFFKVVGALDRAKEINPANRDYLYQMGRLMADPGVARYDEALEFFSKAEPHAKAAFEQGQVYLTSDYSGWSLEKAAAAFRRSLALRPSQGRRVAKLVATLVKLGDREARVDRKTLARRYFEEALGLAHKAVRNRDVSASAQKWLAKIEEDMRRRLEDLETRGDRVNFGLVE
jgi:tetratricopeptide (TPR) repeat protein